MACPAGGPLPWASQSNPHHPDYRRLYQWLHAFFHGTPHANHPVPEKSTAIAAGLEDLGLGRVGAGGGDGGGPQEPPGLAPAETGPEAQLHRTRPRVGDSSDRPPASGACLLSIALLATGGGLPGQDPTRTRKAVWPSPWPSTKPSPVGSSRWEPRQASPQARALLWALP